MDYISYEGEWDCSSLISLTEKNIQKEPIKKNKNALSTWPLKRESKDCRPSQVLKISDFNRIAIYSSVESDVEKIHSCGCFFLLKLSENIT